MSKTWPIFDILQGKLHIAPLGKVINVEGVASYVHHIHALSFKDYKYYWSQLLAIVLLHISFNVFVLNSCDAPCLAMVWLFLCCVLLFTLVMSFLCLGTSKEFSLGV